ncbi:hypothetical protein BJY16_002167 [Actinoplanes octamycinicus]|uniref:Uncharacterized protein n=1 Tax=Actinoplanes octamycinicus TaxID=135948 RepID=A0A7W7M6F1_9ACTN|nr:hypothetical protein [Actinoplanes octamycinicus]MBB4738708.1 hypothetical protein [Actinoplanes octamycinicus]
MSTASFHTEMSASGSTSVDAESPRGGRKADGSPAAMRSDRATAR